MNRLFPSIGSKMSLGGRFIMALLAAVIAACLASGGIYWFLLKKGGAFIPLEQRLANLSRLEEMLAEAAAKGGDALGHLKSSLDALKKSSRKSPYDDFRFYTLNPGRNKDSSTGLPAGRLKRELFVRGKGVMQARLGDKDYWLVFTTLPDTKNLLVGQILCTASADAFFMHFWLAGLGGVSLLCLLAVFWGRIWWRRQFETPVYRLIAHGRMAAERDLVWKEGAGPMPPPLDGLVHVMAQMTQKARRMISLALTSQERFQRLFLDSRDAAFIINPEGCIEEINPAGVSIFGFENQEELFELKNTRCLFASVKERRAYLDILYEKGFVQDLPIRMKRKDGEYFDALITATAGETGESRLGLVKDVTLMRRANESIRQSEERYRRLLANAPDMICRWSVKRGRFDFVSDASLTILGYAPEEITASPDLLRKCLHPDCRDKVVDRWKKVSKGPMHITHSQTYRVIHKSGELRWVSERTTLLPDEEGNADLMEGLLTDVTLQKQIETALIEGNVMVEKTLAGLPVPVMVLDREHKVVHWNRAMASLTNVNADEVIGTNEHWKPFYKEPRPVLADLIIEKNWDDIEEYYGKMSLKHSDVTEGGVSCEGFFPNMGGQDRHLYFLAAPIEDNQGAIVRAVETVVDISDRKRLENELLHLSITDDLTGLFNQRFFFATLNREVESAVRYSQSLALILLDLDFFKQFNDSFGHLGGDRALKKVGGVLQKMIRTTDLACRYGGEEFVILLPRAGYEQSFSVAERVRKGISRLDFKLGDSTDNASVKLTASFGIALFEDGMTGLQLVQQADEAMYQAKERGRNRIVFWGVGDMPILPLDKDD